ncbi:MAG: acetolactate synthase [Deltaproteobacteria bacterium]|nr:acetolactate synthase [Deltaproteobacteria bacterium]MBW2382832.1 acetolactate synthase [Deltaproteobacteria bacterium]MBW2697587.1 acetolactate synthase [Deltaproteobacteria bacterium]
MPVHGGKLAARALKQAGVEVLFTLPGGHIMPLYDGCLDEGIRIVDVRHEQAAVHAADSWARCNPGSIGVAAITAGPGVTDGVTGIANAWRANSPILIFGGQGPFSQLRKGSLQEMDHLGVVRPITKYCDAIYQTHRIPEFIELAIRHAVSGIPGPAFLEVPMDTWNNQVEWEESPIPRIRTESPRISPDRVEVRKAIEALQQAERPMLMAGTSVKWSRGVEAMNRFIAETHIPTYTNGMGRGSVPPDSPEFLNRSRRDALTKIDCIVLAGTLLDFRMRFGQSIPADATIIQLEMDATLIGQNRGTDVPLVGNLGCSFEQLIEEMKNQGAQLDFSSWRDELRVIEDAAEAVVQAKLNSDESPLDPQRMCREVRDWLDTLDSPIVIGDGGDIVSTAAKIIPVKSEGGWMDPGPLGTLGVGMPFALAAQLSHPDKRVVIVYGDGSFGLNGFEYDTAVRFDLPIIGIVGNDAAWGQMMRPQGAVMGWDRLDGTLLRRTRYDKVVEALGGYGELVESPEELRPALERAAASGKPALINVMIKQDREFKGGIYV